MFSHPYSPKFVSHPDGNVGLPSDTSPYTNRHVSSGDRFQQREINIFNKQTS